MITNNPAIKDCDFEPSQLYDEDQNNIKFQDSSSSIAYEKLIAKILDRNSNMAVQIRELNDKISGLANKLSYLEQNNIDRLNVLLKIEKEAYLDLQSKYYFEKNIRFPMAKAIKNLIFRRGFSVDDRISNVREKNLINEAWYAVRYPDVANSGQSAAEHYIRHGFSEGRFPHPLFDTRYYLQENKDVLESGLNPYLHYLNLGWKEGRNPNKYLSSSWYIEKYLSKMQINVEPMNHYYQVGARELLDPGPEFSTKSYIKTHENVDFNIINPLEHFISR